MDTHQVSVWLSLFIIVYYCLLFRTEWLVCSTTVGVIVYYCYSRSTCGRYSGPVVSALDSRSRHPGLSTSYVIVLCSWARHFTLTVPLSTQEYKWVPANCQGNQMKCFEVTCDGLASHPGGVAILLVTLCYGNHDKLWLCGPLLSLMCRLYPHGTSLHSRV